MLIFLIIGISIASPTLVLEQSVNRRELLLLYQKTDPSSVDIRINDYLYPTASTKSYSDCQQFVIDLIAFQRYIISVEGNIDKFKIVAGWITEHFESKFFYFENGDFKYIDYDAPERPQFHLSAPRNWINDPNGFIIINGQYHIFYQYNPLSVNWGNMYWGHAISSDGINWKHLPVALYPGQKVSQDAGLGGAFSGGAFNLDGKLMLVYTDSFQSQNDFIEIQNTTISSDYIHFDQYQTIISERPTEVSQDFRDPVIIKTSSSYLLLLGTNVRSIPSVIKYKSDSPLGPWKYDGVLYSARVDATTVECPSLVQIEGRAILIFSINDYKLKSSYTLYVIGSLYGNEFLAQSALQRLDWGGHYYAAQSYDDLVIAWMQDWNKNSKYLGNKDFSGILTMPRKLTLINEILHQSVIEGAKSLIQFGSEIPQGFRIYQLSYLRFHYQPLFDFEIDIAFDAGSLNIKIVNMKAMLTIREPEVITQISGKMFNTFSDFVLEIWLDRAAVEIFCNQGEVVFSQRFLPQTGGVITFQKQGFISNYVGQITGIYF